MPLRKDTIELGEEEITVGERGDWSSGSGDPIWEDPIAARGVAIRFWKTRSNFGRTRKSPALAGLFVLVELLIALAL